MQTTITCKNCKLEKPANLCLKGNQEYCGDKECQRVRKRLWQKKKMAEDAEYRKEQLILQKDWRQNRPQAEYQRRYREKHPEYVEKSRQQQRIRNQKRRKQSKSGPVEKIVKMDTFRNQPIKSGTYLITPCEMDASGMIVKMDAFLAQINVFYQDNRHSSAPDG